MTDETDIFTDLVRTVAEGLTEDEWFAGAGLEVIADDPGDLDTETRKDRALAMLLTVSRGSVEPLRNTHGVTVEIRISGAEDVILNRAFSGSQKPLGRVLVKVWGNLLSPQWTAGEGWSPMIFTGLSAPDLDDTGRVTRTLSLSIATMITIRDGVLTAGPAYYLTDENGNKILDESGRPITLWPQ